MNIEKSVFKEISTNDIIKKNQIGRGGQGKVYLAYIPGYGDVAIKNFSGNEKDIDFLKEVNIISQVNAPNIIRYYGILSNFEGENWIVMEYAEFNSLSKFLEKLSKKDFKNEFPYTLRYKIALDIISGLFILHENDIIHRDLKSPNILLGSNYIAKISDFGISKLTNSFQSTCSVGTFYWKPPETFDTPFIKESDIYSFGLICWELTTGKLPFNEITSKLKEHITSGKRPLITEDCPKKFANIIIKCWDNNPENRPTSKILMNKIAKLYKNSIENENQYHYSIDSNQSNSSLNSKNTSNDLFELGKMYENGKGMSINYKGAIKYYELSALQNNPEANHRLGLIYFNGELEQNKNFELSIKYFEKGNEESFFFLGNLYFYGNLEFNISNDYLISKKYFELSLNNSNSLNYLGDIYRYGYGSSINYIKSLEYYYKSSELNNSKGLNNLGEMYKNGYGIEQNFEKSFEFFQKSSELNDSNGLNNLGEMYLEGLFISKDLNKAIELFKLSSQLNNFKANYNLGNLYYLGKDLLINYELSFKYFELSKNYFKSQNLLGLFYQNGYFIEKNLNESFKYFELSSNQNYDIAQFNLGLIYLNGNGIKKNIEKSIELFEKSVLQGNKSSLYYLKKLSEKNYHLASNILGNLYENGIFVKKNLIESIKYYKLSIEQGNINSKYSLSMIYLYNNEFENIKEGLKLLNSSAKHGKFESQIQLSKILD